MFPTTRPDEAPGVANSPGALWSDVTKTWGEIAQTWGEIPDQRSTTPMPGHTTRPAHASGSDRVTIATATKTISSAAGTVTIANARRGDA